MSGRKASLNQLIRRAETLARDGDLIGARKIYSVIIDRFPENRRAAKALESLHVSETGSLPRQALEDVTALYYAGRMEDALTLAGTLQSRHPDAPVLLNIMGAAHSALGQTHRAIGSFRKALEIKPDYADAYGNLGVALHHIGETDEAIDCYRRAVDADPDREDVWQNLGNAIKQHRFGAWDDKTADLIVALLGRPASVRPSDISAAIASLLKHHPVIGPALAPFSGLTASPDTDGFDVAQAQLLSKSLAQVTLLCRLLEHCPIPDPAMEHFLTGLRHGMLRAANDGGSTPLPGGFASTLAVNCFINEYVFDETETERRILDAAERRIETALGDGQTAVSPDIAAIIAAVASYRPLSGYEWAHGLTPPEGLAVLFEYQVSEVAAERSLREKIPVLKEIEDQTSARVRDQYEESPYPRWIKTEMRARPSTVAAIIGALDLDMAQTDTPNPDSPEILIAGCGTGQQAIRTSSRFAGCHVLAIDLSLASLAYGIRKTRALGLSNIDFLQADILDIEQLGRRFDIIESTGVLHHLEDPMAGWRALTNCLEPGGLMKIALYSEAARKIVTLARDRIRALGLSGTVDGIRKFRQDILDAKDGRGDHGMLWPLTSSPEFYSMSECRDLLFHVQEHHFTLPRIEAALEALNLRFLGFEIADNRVRQRFRESFPAREDRYSLTAWHRFECENPTAFAGMYQFWATPAGE